MFSPGGGYKSIPQTRFWGFSLSSPRPAYIQLVPLLVQVGHAYQTLCVSACVGVLVCYDLCLGDLRVLISNPVSYGDPFPTSSEVNPPAPLSQRSQTTPLPTHYAPRHAHRDSNTGRPPSSVYSQPSPLQTNFRLDRPVNVNVRYRPSPDDVSPPSSPELLSPGHEYVPIW